MDWPKYRKDHGALTQHENCYCKLDSGALILLILISAEPNKL